MQFSKNTRFSENRNIFAILIKVILVLMVIFGIIILLNKIDFPSPNKEIEKVIPNEKIKIVK
jgi:hypothetical protein|tara:strand:+ start:45 stop:230 length:186 start_codon:yes stop_codon:yes gene_type:complete